MTGNKVAIVTGAGKGGGGGGGGGIGRGIAVQLAKAGWSIVINNVVSQEDREQTLALVEAEGVEGVTVQGDITVADDRHRIMECAIHKFGRIDMLVNNAGVGPRDRLDMLEISEESMQEVLAVNLYGTFFLSQLVANKMIELIDEKAIEGGKIVNISSISAYTSSTSRAEYCISKAAVSMSTILFADRLSKEKINVYEIRPGIIKTPMTEAVKGKYDKLIAEGLTPIKRWGEPQDIGKAIVAIAKDYFPFSTGQVFDVDGGFHLKRL